MSDFNRRKLMKTLGASSLAITGTSGIAAAETSASPGDTEELSKYEAYRYLLKSLEYEPVKEMRSYLRQEKRAWIDADGLSGTKIILEDKPTHVVLNMPVATTRGQEGTLVIRVFEKTAIATVDIDGSVLKSNPDVVGSDVSSTSSTGGDYGVVTAQEWRERSDSNDGEVSIQIDCDTTYGPVDVGGPLCDLISGLALLVGTAASVVPEPGSTAIGVVILTGGTAGSCQVGDAIDDLYGNCNVTKVKICAEWNCSLDPISGVWCDPEVTIWSPDCS